jgi:N-glycosylase/DNA lyase
MKDLLHSIELLKNSEINELIRIRIKEFSEIRFKSDRDIFKELCFCIMTANCGAEKCIEIFETIGDDFLNFSQIQLMEKFKELGYRFPNVRSKYIIEAREYKNELEKKIKYENKEINKNNDVREWIVENIKGIGYKEGSHFLRNIGYINYAIIDFHIIDLLAKYNLIKKPKTMTKRKYLEIEGLLREIGEKLKLNLAELDLYLWFLETGKVLK